MNNGTKSMRIRVRAHESIPDTLVMDDAVQAAKKYLPEGANVRFDSSWPDEDYAELVWHQFLAGDAA